ncbi:hypothetical protein [Streptomyces sp. SM11]|uniref:hypothetical protein n=1 Tax=Streptomyces sp. SM11 TaxID=565557 RepID=UPI0021562332|nr:hypothetical protein [Streptomyces sp. SM11]
MALIGSAAVGVFPYFVGAVVTHLRAKDHEIDAPVVLALPAVAAPVLRVMSAWAPERCRTPRPRPTARPAQSMRRSEAGDICAFMLI